MTAAEQKAEKEAIEKAKKEKTPLPRPAFSACGKLVKSPSEGESCSSPLNRWHRFFGIGPANPLDQMHSENPAEPPGFR